MRSVMGLSAVSQVFMKRGVLRYLEQQRDQQVTGWLVYLQASCLGHLARQKYRKLKVSVSLQWWLSSSDLYADDTLLFPQEAKAKVEDGNLSIVLSSWLSAGLNMTSISSLSVLKRDSSSVHFPDVSSIFPSILLGEFCWSEARVLSAAQVVKPLEPDLLFVILGSIN